MEGKLCFELFVSFSCQLISRSMVFWTADFHFITMIALRGSLKGSQGFSLAGTYTHTHTHIPGSPIPLRAPRCLHGQSTSSNQLKTALSSWSMAEVGVGQDEDSGRGEQLFNFMTQWEFLFGLPIWSSSPWDHTSGAKCVTCISPMWNSFQTRNSVTVAPHCWRTIVSDETIWS